MGIDGSSARSKKARLLSLDAVTRTGDFASSGANESNLHRVATLLILDVQRQARLLDFRLTWISHAIGKSCDCQSPVAAV
jgi:hypothetical protein